MKLLHPLRPAASLLATASNDPISKILSYSTHSSFRDLIDRYDGFILDQFGVLHNGANALPGAVQLVDYLAKDCGKKLVILSNTSAPAHKAKLRLPKFGFDPESFVGIVTSGEEAARHIRETYQGSKSTALMFTWDTSDLGNPRLTAMPQAFLEHCNNLQVAASVDQADFLLLHGSEVWYRGDDIDPLKLGRYVETGDMDDFVDPILQQCVDRGLSAVCANPDYVVQTPSGGQNYMPGKIAQRYEDMGGKVQVFGKPEAEHFQACVRTLGLPIDNVVHVGDSLQHDIAGATAAGISSTFVTSGIHMSQLCSGFGDLPKQHLLDQLFVEEGVTPDHVVSAFQL